MIETKEITIEERKKSGVELLNSLVGIPWQEDGRDKQGTDCVGLMELYFRNKGVEAEAPKMSEAKALEPEKLAQRIKEGAEVIKANQLKEGDVLVFRFEDELHVGLFLGFGKMLHAKRGARSRISRLSLGWCKHFVFALRPKNGKIYLPPAGPPVAVAVVGAMIGGAAAAITGATLFGSVMLGIAWGVIGGAAMGYSIGLAMNPPRFAMDAVSPRYRFGKLETTSSNQLPLPRIYGKVRVAGNIVHQTPVAGGEVLEQLIMLSEGEIQSVTDIRLNGEVIANFPGCSTTVFLGTSTQNVETTTGLPLGGVQYRNRACLYVKLQTSDKLKGGRPTVTCVVEGQKVPIWNGVDWATIAYSQNPAACLRDYMLTPKQRGGCGHEEIDLDDNSFAEVYVHCDELVPDGAGGTEKRFQIGFVLDQRKPAIDYISEMNIGFGGMLFRSGERFKLKVIKAETSVLSLTEEEHIGNLEVIQKGLDDKINRFGIEYFDPDQNDARILVWGAEDKADQKRRGLVEKTLTIAAIDRKTQAIRLANQYFYELKLNSLLVEMLVGLDAIALEPGDVVKVTHSLMGWTDKLFRVLELEEDESDIYRIRAQEYNPTIYNDRYGASIQVFNFGTPPNPNAPVGEVTGLIVSENLITNDDGTSTSQIRVTYTAPAVDSRIFLSHYQIELQKGAGAFIVIGTTDKTEFLTNLNLEIRSTYNIRVKTVSINNIVSDGIISSVITLTGGQGTPPDVTNLEVWGQGNDTHFRGKDVKFRWVERGHYGAGDIPAGDSAGHGARDAYFKDFEVNILVGGEVKRVELVTTNEYEYTWEKNAQDNVMLVSTFTIRVWQRNHYNIRSATFAELTVTNPPPKSVSGVMFDFSGRDCTISWSPHPSSDVDFRRYKIIVTGAGGSRIYYRDATSFFYSYDENVNQHGGNGDRSLTVELYAEDWFEQLSSVTTISPTNPAPAAPTVTVTPFFNLVMLKWIDVVDTDLKYYEVWQSATGVWGGEEILIHKTAGWSAILKVTEPTLYFKVRGVDTFGVGSFSGSKRADFVQLVTGDLGDNIVTAAKVTTGELLTLSAQIKAAIIQDAHIANLDGGKIAAASITANKLSVTQLSAIAADLGTITAGLVTGATIRTAASGSRIEMDINRLVAFDNAPTPAEVFKILLSGVDVGDVIIGNFAGNKGIKWDKSAGLFEIRGKIMATAGDFTGTVNVGTAGRVRIDGAGEVIRVFDAANNLRVELGKLA